MRPVKGSRLQVVSIACLSQKGHIAFMFLSHNDHKVTSDYLRYPVRREFNVQ